MGILLFYVIAIRGFMRRQACICSAPRQWAFRPNEAWPNARAEGQTALV